MSAMQTCPKCGAPLAADAPQGLCPKCLMEQALSSQPEPGATRVATSASPAPRALPQTGEQFGGYRIVRELGRGGMGAVYDAEHLESGRRVALKVLSHQLDSPEARKRFLREGRLAASINHPNSVYVYGTEEIAGTPVIAMELIAGGTLQERVQHHGPLPIAEAVDAVLQVIAGLEAAQAIGILHRDIKPANCFEDADGMVKVGDFGLSISTAVRGDTNLTLQGTFLGTPAFCSPEQLRGEELNVRSDMYSVGVTLFYLLTGRTPFEAKNMVQLLANVLEQPAPSPRKFRSVIPQGLAKTILRCLEKQPGERFRNYDELRQALTPFGSTAPTPATLGMRFLAAALDHLLLSGTVMTVHLMVLGDLATYANPATYRSPKFFAWVTATFLAMLLYYTLLEGLWGASLGKRICRLRVAGPDRNPPGVIKALIRAAVFLILPPLPCWIALGFAPWNFAAVGSSAWPQFVGFSNYLILALLFCTARRRNGFAAVHDLLTNTRVTRKPAYQARPVLPTSEEAAPVAEANLAVGPYHILKSLEKTATGDWLLGYDTQLLRKVWIRVMPPGTPPLVSHLRNLGRVGRLRWIAGRRSPQENWDAFEGVAGEPLMNLLHQRQPWSQVRFWLLDLAQEISAAEKDGTLPAVLSPDRVWITADGRAKLLDFPAPGVASSGQPDDAEPAGIPPLGGGSSDPRRFLHQIACSALEGRAVEAAEKVGSALRVPLPLHARSWLEKLPALPGAEAIVAALKPLLQNVATVSRWRRAGLIAGCLAFPLLAAVVLMFGMRLLDKWQRQQPDIMPLNQLLAQRSVLHWPLPWMKDKPMPDDRAFAIYIASHYRQTITNKTTWTTLYAVSMVAGEKRRFAEQSVAAHPHPTEQEIIEATAALKPFLPNAQMNSFMLKPWFALVVFGSCLLFYVGLPALLTALLFRGGLVLRVLGVAVVRKDGARASRLRIFWRSLVAWSPVLSAPALAVVLIPLLAALTAPRGPNLVAVETGPVRAESPTEMAGSNVIKTAETNLVSTNTLAVTNASQAVDNVLAATNAPAVTKAPAPAQDTDFPPFGGPMPSSLIWCGLLLVLLIIGLPILSLALPDRSLQDRLAGTCLVPR